METSLLGQEGLLRLAAFAGVFAAMAAWELAAPRRRLDPSRAARWPANLGVVVVDTLVARLLFPAASVGVALSAAENASGLLNVFSLPGPVAVVLGIVALDLAIYLQHVVFHAVPALWRLHRMHHADLAMDVTSGARFHPIEIVLSLLVKFAVIVALGVPALAVLAFEILLNASSMFNHSNVRMPARLEAVLRWLVVTPDMHRVHHSVDRAETDSNFGFNLAIWDRLFGTYRAQPRAGHEAMVLGIREFRDPHECSSLPAMLAMPFRDPAHAGTRRLEPRHEGG